MAETMVDIDDHMLVDAGVPAALGVTLAELKAMGLRQFIDLATDRGYDVKVSAKPAPDSRSGRLTISHSPSTSDASDKG
jgi:hypothetical protein